MKKDDEMFDVYIEKLMDVLRASDDTVSFREITKKTGIESSKLASVISRATFRYPIYEDGKKIGLLKDEDFASTPRELEEIRKRINSKAYMDTAVNALAENMANNIVEDTAMQNAVRKPLITPMSLRKTSNDNYNNYNSDSNTIKETTNEEGCVRKMKNNLQDLADSLFAQVDKLLDDTICADKEKTETEIKKCNAMCAVASQITKIGSLQLEAVRLSSDGEKLPDLIDCKNRARGYLE